MRIFLISSLLFCSCIISNKIRNADTAVELKKYALAAQLYMRDFETAKAKDKKADLAFKIGDCYTQMANFSNSLTWYKKSYELLKSNKALLAYAYSLKSNEDYKDAYGAFVELTNESTGGAIYRREANICKLAQEWKNKNYNGYYYQINNSDFNTDANEYSPYFDRLGKLYFSSDRLGTLGKNKYEWSGYFFSDLFSLTESKEIESLGSDINTKNNEGTCSLNANGNTIYFTRCSDLGVGDHYCQIYVKSLNQEIEVDEMLNLGGDISNNINPALHPSDSILIYSSDRSDGKGKFDLYSSILRNGTWTVGINLGELINTEGNEKFPVWNKDTLYFSSDYLPGFGGLDIFKTWLTKNGSWASPQRLDYPINSGSDDFNFTIDPNFIPNDSVNSLALFSSNRNESKGDDIFEVKKVIQPLLQVQKSYYAKILAKFNFFKTLACSANQTTAPLDSIFVKIDNSNSNIQTGNKSSLSLQLQEGQDYILQSGRNGYLNNKLEFQTKIYKELLSDSTISLDFNIYLVPFEYNKEFLLENVYYDYNQSDIREDAKPSLNKLFELLKANPNIRIQVASHTDCRGDIEYNQVLSDARAQSVRNYLISLGINQQNLEYQGFGESQNIINCNCENCTEEEHQLNRRSTFKIIR